MAIALNGSGCSLVGDEVGAVEGTYRFSNAFGYVERIVVRPDYVKDLRFAVEGEVSLEEADGQVEGTGTCIRSRESLEQPGDIEDNQDQTTILKFTAQREGDRLVQVRIDGCAFPRRMEGRIERGRIVLNTDLDFPVSGGTTVFSDRFGDPSRLIMTRSEG